MGDIVYTRDPYLDQVKGLAMVSVICAHCNAVLVSENRFAIYSSLLLSNIGTWGVLCFFFVSGLLFKPSKGWKEFITKKSKEIIVPWILSGIVVYLYVHIRKPPVTLPGLLNFIIGNGSYLYYLTVLLLLYVFFFFLPISKSKPAAVLLFTVSFYCVVFKPEILGISPYLNACNWMGYFAAGMLFGRNDIAQIKKQLRAPLLVFFVLSICIIMTYLNIISNNPGSYWGVPDAILSIIGAISILVLSSFQNNKKMAFIGQNSLYYYLWHMPIAGIVARVMNYKWLVYFTVIRPFIVLLILTAFLYAIKRVVPKSMWFAIGVR